MDESQIWPVIIAIGVALLTAAIGVYLAGCALGRVVTV